VPTNSPRMPLGILAIIFHFSCNTYNKTDYL
jgi:hypothetical protein